ncbi:hypothetical protein CK203_060854 [Vitis vinifera]|uniref:Uncharacterized protein n=1 Tax=Vitis vinifera TaxID=29760 RepID=A0A438FU92_VITVI|nr:hypothetical protein CK203_060854 [Vitis vinifera]
MWRSLQKQDRNKAKGTEHCNSSAKLSPAHECHFAHLKAIFAPCESRCENFAHLNPSAKLSPGTRVPFRTPQATFRTVRTRCEIFDSAKLSAKLNPSLWNSQQPSRSISAMAKTREVFPHPHPRRCLDQSSPPLEAPLRHLLRTPPFPHLRVERLLSRYPTRRPPTDPVPPPPKPRGLLLGHREEDQVLGSWRAIPDTSGRAAYRGLSDSVGIPLETVIRRPMIAGPPIEGNLDCRDRSFHSETWFVEALRQPELRDSFRLLQRRPESYSHHFTIDGRQGIGARHIAEASVYLMSLGTSTASVLTRRELPSGMLLIDVLLRANIFPLQHKRKSIREASEGRCHSIVFPRLLCQILEHLGYPGEPRLERRRHCREDFSLDKWHHLAAYFAPQGPQLASTSGAPDVPPPPELPKMSSYLRPSRMRFSLTYTSCPCSTHLSAHA